MVLPENETGDSGSIDPLHSIPQGKRPSCWQRLGRHATAALRHSIEYVPSARNVT